jgi:hypothetical protein
MSDKKLWLVEVTTHVVVYAEDPREAEKTAAQQVDSGEEEHTSAFSREVVDIKQLAGAVGWDEKCIPTGSDETIGQILE